MKKQSPRSKHLLPKPGDTILETIEQLKMSQAELADRMGKTPSKINDLISAKEPITQATALQLEKVLGIPASFWLKSETGYREQLARIEDAEKMACWVPWAEAHPIRELKKCGYLTSAAAITSVVEELLLFYGVVSPAQWEIVCVPQKQSVQYRKSNTYTASVTSLTAWLRMGELEMKKLSLPSFDKEKLKLMVPEFRDMARLQKKRFAMELKEKCTQLGLALIYTRCLPHAPVSGATRWIKGNPLIQLTDRYKTNDHFWFTFFHELAHVLLHGRKDIFLEDVEDFANEQDKETEANNFASKWLLPDSALDSLPEKIGLEEIMRLAKSHRIHPGIIVGRLQHERRIPFSFGNDLKEKISLFDRE
jgi:HTH-type transcriptional regulator/antitoxin HigA